MALGSALETAQLLETAIGTSLLALDALEKGTYIKPDAEAYLRLRDEVDHQTLGRSLKRMRDRLNFPEEPESLFSRALEARNFLVHHLIRYYGIDLVDESKHADIVGHIGKLQSEMDAAYAVAERITIGLVNLIEHLRRQNGIEA